MSYFSALGMQKYTLKKSFGQCMRNYQFWYYIKMEMTTVALVNSFITILRNMYLRVILKSFKIFRIFLFWQAIVAHYIIIGTIIKNRSHTYRAIYPKSELLNLTQRYVLTFTLKVITLNITFIQKSHKLTSTAKKVIQTETDSPAHSSTGQVKYIVLPSV